MDGAVLHARAEGRRFLTAVLMVTTALTTIGFAGEASAQNWQDRLRQLDQGAPSKLPDWSSLQLAQAAATRPDFNIPPQPLADALTLFGRQSGMQVSVDAELVRGLSSPGVTGTMTAEQALARLLAGTGIAYQITGNNTAMLQRAPSGAAQPNPVDLPPVVVEATANRNSDITSLPAPYAGNQVARGGRVGSLGNRDMMETPFKVTSYTNEVIRNQQADSIAEVLQNDPAVRTTYGFGNFSEQFVIRGFPLSGDDIAIDGLYGLAPRQIIATEMFERVEVLVGASAFLNGVAPGNTGIGGSVNLVPKRAGDNPLTRLTTSYAQDSRFGGAADVSRRFGPDNEFGVRVNLAGRGGETSVDNEERQTVLGSAAFDYRGDRFRGTLDLSYQRQIVDQGRPVVFVNGPIVPDAPSATTNYAPAWSYSRLRDSAAQFRGEYDVTQDLMGYIAFGARDMREDGNYGSPTVNAAGIGTVSRLTVPREDWAASGQTGARFKAETGPLKHTFDVGVSALRTINRNSFQFSGTQPTNIHNPPILSEPGTAFASGDFEDLPKVSRSDLKSATISDTLSVLNDRIILVVGGRHQWMDIKGYDRVTGATTSSFKDEATSPVVGLVVRPVKELSLYANRIEGLAQGPTAPATAINIGQVFPPFKSTQYEVGAKLDFGMIGGSVAVFQTKQPSGVTDPNTLIFGVSGEQRNRGIELQVFGEPLTGVRLLGGVTFINSELEGTAGGTNDGNDGVGVPHYQVNLGAEWDPWFMRNVTLAARVIHTSSQFLDQANTQKVTDWSRLDLGARYRTEIENRMVVFRANVENVTNEAYWASANGGYLLQGLPLTAKLSVSVDF